MELPEELKELLRLLNSNTVDYLIIGAYALGYHGVPRYTGDLDLFIAPNPDNADALLRTMDNFGFGSLGLEQKDFTTFETKHRPAVPWISEISIDSSNALQIITVIDSGYSTRV